MKKLKLIPPFTTFLAGAITSIWLYLADASLLDTLVILLAVLFGFYFLGVVVMKLLEDIWEDELKRKKEEEKKLKEEGEMIEKELIENENSSAES